MDRSHAFRTVLACMAAGLVLLWAQSARTESPKSRVEPDAGNWGTWAASSGSTIKVPPPPDATATASEIRELKTQLAHDAATLDRIAYWDRGWPGYRWQEIALAESQKDQKPNFWRTMALVSVAISDATIAAWHAKYEYSRPRPSDSDPTIEPAILVPRSPSYPSEHAAVAAATADVLAYIFPNDAALFARRADEAAQSRVAAGVQYPSDAKAGLELGHQIGAAVIACQGRPIGDSMGRYDQDRPQSLGRDQSGFDNDGQLAALGPRVVRSVPSTAPACAGFSADGRRTGGS
jgi:hypothetical protein